MASSDASIDEATLKALENGTDVSLSHGLNIRIKAKGTKDISIIKDGKLETSKITEIDVEKVNDAEGEFCKSCLESRVITVTDLQNKSVGDLVSALEKEVLLIQAEKEKAEAKKKHIADEKRLKQEEEEEKLQAELCAYKDDEGNMDVERNRDCLVDGIARVKASARDRKLSARDKEKLERQYESYIDALSQDTAELVATVYQAKMNPEDRDLQKEARAAQYQLNQLKRVRGNSAAKKTISKALATETEYQERELQFNQSKNLMAQASQIQYQNPMVAMQMNQYAQNQLSQLQNVEKYYNPGLQMQSALDINMSGGLTTDMLSAYIQRNDLLRQQLNLPAIAANIVPLTTTGMPSSSIVDFRSTMPNTSSIVVNPQLPAGAVPLVANSTNTVPYSPQMMPQVNAAQSSGPGNIGLNYNSVIGMDNGYMRIN